ncbi:MAG: hypothetical protein MJ132_02725, partial [Clostridia bacterium]|nr:hypothetical protein [Clostridia bacterium]
TGMQIRYCDRCHKSETKEIPKTTDHDWIVLCNVSGNCYEQGLKTCKCTRCNLCTHEALPQLSHEYSNDICVHCGASNFSVTYDFNHDHFTNADDLILLRQDILCGENASVFDVNGDASVDVRDLVHAKKAFAAANEKTYDVYVKDYQGNRSNIIVAYGQKYGGSLTDIESKFSENIPARIEQNLSYSDAQNLCEFITDNGGVSCLVQSDISDPFRSYDVVLIGVSGSKTDLTQYIYDYYADGRSIDILRSMVDAADTEPLVVLSSQKYGQAIEIAENIENAGGIVAVIENGSYHSVFN